MINMKEISNQKYNKIMKNLTNKIIILIIILIVLLKPIQTMTLFPNKILNKTNQTNKMKKL